MLNSLIRLLEIISKKKDADREAVIMVFKKVAEHANDITISWTEKLTILDGIFLKMQNAEFSMENKTVSMLIGEQQIAILAENPPPNHGYVYRMDQMLAMMERLDAGLDDVFSTELDVLSSDANSIAVELEKFLDVRHEAFTAYTETFDNLKSFSDEYIEQSLAEFDIEKFREIVTEMQRQSAVIEVMCDTLRLPGPRNA